MALHVIATVAGRATSTRHLLMIKKEGAPRAAPLATAKQPPGATLLAHQQHLG